LRIAVAGRGQAAEGDARRSAIVDRDGNMPGRGAYLCRDADASAPATVDGACLERALRRGGIARALRSSVTVDPKLVESVKRVAQQAAGRPAGPLALSKS
jgi:predicted RNA-binding protein YlxR (DUF448 family)